MFKRIFVVAVSVACVSVMTSCASAEEKSYKEALKLRDEGQYEDAIEILKDIQSYEDSTSLIEDSYECLIDECLDNGKFDDALDYIEDLGEYTNTGDMLSDTVCDLYHNGDISLNSAMEYVSAYDLLDNEERAFVDFEGIHDDNYVNTITGLYHLGYYDSNGEVYSDTYLVWFVNQSGRNDYFLWTDDGGLYNSDIEYMMEVQYSPDTSYDYELINLALRGH